MTECLNNLIGLKDLCEPDDQVPVFYLDDIEGMDRVRLSRLAESDESGEALFNSIKQSSIRLLQADIDSVIPTNYRLVQQLSQVCSACDFSSFYEDATLQGTGIIITDTSNSRFTKLRIDSLKVQTGSTGEFTLVISDGAKEKTITQQFEAGELYNFKNIGFETSAKIVKIYFADPAVKLSMITCGPASSGCGCGGGPKTIATDIVIRGLVNNVPSQTQYGILPCVDILCSGDDIACNLVNASPRLFGLALLYLMASKAFENNSMSERINKTASFDQEDKKDLSEYYYSLYRERLTGNSKKQILGIAQAINQNLKNVRDRCVECSSPNTIAWAI